MTHDRHTQCLGTLQDFCEIQDWSFEFCPKKEICRRWGLSRLPSSTADPSWTVIFSQSTKAPCPQFVCLYAHVLSMQRALYKYVWLHCSLLLERRYGESKHRLAWIFYSCVLIHYSTNLCESCSTIFPYSFWLPIFTSWCWDLVCKT